MNHHITTVTLDRVKVWQLILALLDTVANDEPFVYVVGHNPADGGSSLTVEGSRSKDHGIYTTIYI